VCVLLLIHEVLIYTVTILTVAFRVTILLNCYVDYQAPAVYICNVL